MKLVEKFVPAMTLILVLAVGMAVVVPSDLAAQQQQQQQQPQLSRLSKQAISRRVVKEILGKEVVSIDNKDAGVVFDLAVDSLDGRVAYAVIDHRRNGRLHAIPFELFREEGGKLMVAVEHSKLEPSRGFTKGDWPEMDDLEWARKVHSFYGTTPYWEVPSRASAQDTKDAKDVKAADEKPRPRFNDKYTWMNRASLMIDIPIKSATGDDLGRVSDLVLDMRYGLGHIVYAVVSGAPGLGQNITVIPFSAMEAKPKDKGYVVDATAEDLRVGSLKESDWQATADPNWNRRVHSAFKEEPYWNVFAAPQTDDADDDQAFQPGGAYLKNFDTRKTRTFNGKVTSVGEFDLRQNAKGKQIVITAEDGKDYTIHLGPVAYFEKGKSDLSLEAGDQVTVRAFRGIVDGKEVFMADQLSKVYELRDSTGRGVWRKNNRQK